MSLSELPPEIFKHIVHYAVYGMGIQRAVILRQVNRAFASEIKHDLLSHQTIDVIDPNRKFWVGSANFKPPHKMLIENIGYILYRRLKDPLDADRTFVAKTRQFTQFIIRRRGVIGYAAIDKCTYLACQGLADMMGELALGNLYRQNYIPWRIVNTWEYRHEFTIQDEAAAALAMGEFDTGEKLIREISGSSNPTLETSGFRNILQNAIRKGNEKTVNMILSCYIAQRGSIVGKSLTDDIDMLGLTLWSAMDESIFTNHPSLLKLLFETCGPYGPVAQHHMKHHLWESFYRDHSRLSPLVLRVILDIPDPFLIPFMSSSEIEWLLRRGVTLESIKLLFEQDLVDGPEKDLHIICAHRSSPKGYVHITVDSKGFWRIGLDSIPPSMKFLVRSNSRALKRTSDVNPKLASEIAKYIYQLDDLVFYSKDRKWYTPGNQYYETFCGKSRPIYTIIIHVLSTCLISALMVFVLWIPWVILGWLWGGLNVRLGVK
ncbi:hypothetical protein DM02DRAFT_682637 [Periconia macrospinosa]|uniref:Uncharacterized protein n=1 Tax=Periconia macrospinosa TaxID=97972 RepID=A0A2V1DM98_9PLEO|nr:hypothetical protein DM02DRAFT_682637 [Periconia macrospinosa]